MPDRIIHKRSLTVGSIPTTSSLEIGELAINVADGKIHLRRSGSANNDVVSVVTANTITTGSIRATAGFTGSLFGSASHAETASFAPNYLPLTGGTITGNLNVIGTASFAYTTASIVQVGASTITLNTDFPSVRFGGISVIDSGSFGNSSTGSLFWDSLNNKWIYSNPSGSTYDSGMLISGPRNTNGLGNESGLTQFVIPVSQGSDHIQDSQIYSSGSITIVTGSLTVTSGITGSLSGSATNAISSSYAGTASFAPDYVQNAVTSSMLQPYVLSSSTGSFITSDQTSSFVLNSVTSSMLEPYVLTASTASMLQPYVLTSVTSSMTVLSSSFATTASYISPTFISASAAAAGFGSGGSTAFPYTGSAYITGSLIVTGSINGSFDIIAGGDLKSNYSSGDEGGQIFLNKPVTNTAITGGVNIDVYQNRIRFFENGGTARGAYIDLTACAAGAATNLLSGSSGGLTFNEVQRIAFLRI